MVELGGGGAYEGPDHKKAFWDIFWHFYILLIDPCWWLLKDLKNLYISFYLYSSMLANSQF